jgi:hypothetical protein
MIESNSWLTKIKVRLGRNSHKLIPSQKLVNKDKKNYSKKLYKNSKKSLN